MFIPIPMSFSNPKTAQTVNFVFLVIGLFLILVPNWILGGGLMTAFAIFNLVRMNNQKTPKQRNSQDDKDGFV